MAETVGISLRSVQRIWQAHEIMQPHRLRTFMRSNDLDFAAPRFLLPDQRGRIMPEKLTFDVAHGGQPTITLELNKDAGMWQDLSASDCLITAGGNVVASAGGLSCNNSGSVMVNLKSAKWNNCPPEGEATLPNAANCPADGWRWTLRAG